MIESRIEGRVVCVSRMYNYTCIIQARIFVMSGEPGQISVCVIGIYSIHKEAHTAVIDSCSVVISFSLLSEGFAGLQEGR